jgi:hypothetical protein
VHVPVDVTVTLVAVSSTETDLPDNNSDDVAVFGETTPTSAVRLKLGPKSAPNPELSVNNTFIFYFYIKNYMQEYNLSI